MGKLASNTTECIGLLAIFLTFNHYLLCKSNIYTCTMNICVFVKIERKTSEVRGKKIKTVYILIQFHLYATQKIGF